jgi:hypothetical protein
MTTGKKIILLVALTAAGVFGVRQYQQNRLPMERQLISTNDSLRGTALRKFVSQSEADRKRVAEGLVKLSTQATEPRERRFALYALRKSGLSDPFVVDAIVKGLGDGNESVREEASVGITEMGDRAISALVALLGEPASGRELLIATLARVATAESMPAIMEGLSSDDPDRVRAVSDLFWRIKDTDVKEAAAPAVPMLAELVRSTHTAIALPAAFSLHALAPQDKRVVPAFLRVVDEEAHGRWTEKGERAVRALGDIPSAAPQTVPVLKKLIRSAPDGMGRNEGFPRSSIAQQLERLEPRDRSLHGLAWDLKNRDHVIRYRALLVLSSTPTIHPVLKEPLEGCLADSDPVNSARANYCLSRLSGQ